MAEVARAFEVNPNVFDRWRRPAVAGRRERKGGELLDATEGVWYQRKPSK